MGSLVLYRMLQAYEGDNSRYVMPIIWISPGVNLIALSSGLTYLEHVTHEGLRVGAAGRVDHIHYLQTIINVKE